MSTEEIAVIGAGPAGIAAAIQLSRQGIAPVVFEKNRIGGLLHNANLVENYPGFPGGITGPELAVRFEKHFLEHRIRLVNEKAEKLEWQDETFHIRTAEETFEFERVVIATGTKPVEYTGVEIPADCRPFFLYEITPLLEEEDKQIVIIGAGDAAFDYALNLGRHNDITILNRGDRTRCLPLLEKRAAESDRIVYMTDTTVSKVRRHPEFNLHIDCKTYAGIAILEADYMVAAIGREPELDLLSTEINARLNELKKKGRLYCIGDVVGGRFRQTAIAVGEAVRAAMEINRKAVETMA